MTNPGNVQPQKPSVGGEYGAGRRSITQRGGKSRFEIVREKKNRSIRGRKYVYGGVGVLVVLLAVIIVGYWNAFVSPPRQLAIRVGDVEYSRGDVVDLIRFNQRLSEQIGIPFQLGSSVFEALQTIQEAELSYQLAPQYGISVSPEEVDERIAFILGFGLAGTDIESPEYQANLEETKRQFLNNVGLPESVWRDFLKKVLFQERLREVVGDSIPRIQPQVHVYQVLLEGNSAQLEQKRQLIAKELAAGNNIEDVVVSFSADIDVKRNRGDLGWMPKGITTPQIDNRLFGVGENGARLLPLNTPAVPSLDDSSGMWSIIIIDQYQEAREVEEDALGLLKDKALTVFLNEQRKNIDLYLDLNSDIANWINKQVSLDALDVTPAVGPADPLQGLLPDGASIAGPAPTPVPTPRGIPGISAPIK
ncbi:MAG: peptidylprolyl isomerase [Chloroflexi bacterium]|nr:peptidylprolyl isomerase [Chloroflexota bacterium]